jgi:hypothetical protein
VSGVLPSLWAPSGLRAAQDALLAKATGFDATVNSCAGIDAGTKTSWAAFLSALTAFAKTDYGWLTTTTPDGKTSAGGGTGETADQIESYQRELFAWGQKLQGASCALTVPNVDPTVTGPGADQIVTAVKYASIAAVFVGSAYAVGKLAALLPSRAERRATRVTAMKARRAAPRLAPAPSR